MTDGCRGKDSKDPVIFCFHAFPRQNQGLALAQGRNFVVKAYFECQLHLRSSEVNRTDPKISQVGPGASFRSQLEDRGIS